MCVRGCDAGNVNIGWFMVVLPCFGRVPGARKSGLLCFGFGWIHEVIVVHIFGEIH